MFQIGEDSGEDCNKSNMASEVSEQNQEDEEVDVTDLSSLDNNQLCLRYQQVNVPALLFLMYLFSTLLK